jgi:hypothetical protein
VEIYLHSPNKPSWLGAFLKHRDNFIFTFTGAYAAGPSGHKGQNFSKTWIVGSNSFQNMTTFAVLCVMLSCVGIVLRMAVHEPRNPIKLSKRTHICFRS